MQNTKKRIMNEAVKLFACRGYDGTSMEAIAARAGIKAPSIYKHFKSKSDVFDAILREMERRDAENAAQCGVPQESIETEPGSYSQTEVTDLLLFCRMQFRFWTEDAFAVSFRKMLTAEHYRSEDTQKRYRQYLGDGPLFYTADILGSAEAALALYAPMHLLYSVYDHVEDKSVAENMFETHLAAWFSSWNQKLFGGCENEISVK